MFVVHFDVLALPSDTTIKRQPSLEGRRLWNTMFEEYKGRMVVVADVDTREEILSEWLKRENLKPSYIHVADDFVREGSTARQDALWWVNTNLGRPHWYADSDADTCAAAVRMGIPTMLIAIPAFSRPEWHEPGKMRPWDVVVSEVETQILKRNEKTWGDDD